MTSCGVYQLVNPKKGETVFWAGVVKICEIQTHPLFPVGLLNHDDISKPLKVKDFSDETDSLKFFYFFHDNLIPL